MKGMNELKMMLDFIEARENGSEVSWRDYVEQFNQLDDEMDI